MKDDEFKQSKEFNDYDEFKHFDSENFNAEEYNKRLKEYLKTNEINTNDKKTNEQIDNSPKDPFKNQNDVNNIEKLSHGLKKSLSTIATTLGSSVVVVAASAAIVTNVFVPKPKIDLDYDVSYNSIEYRIQMKEVDESLNYFILLGNNNDSYRIEIPKDNNPDDHFIEYVGYQDNLKDNELYHIDVIGEDFEKETTSNFYKTKFVTKKFSMPNVNFDIQSRLENDFTELRINYNIILSDYKPSSKKYYSVTIKYNEEVLLEDDNLVNNQFNNQFVIPREILEEILRDENNVITFEVFENKGNKQKLVKKEIFNYDDFLP